MLSEDSSPQSIFQKISNFLLRNIPIENSTPSKLLTTLICLHYAFDYIILWGINASLLNVQPPPLSINLPFFLIRLLTSMAFVFSKMPVFFLLNKVAIGLELFVTIRQPIYMQVLNIVLEIVMCGVWTLSKQQRMIHFDSRMGLTRTFIKQICIYVAVLGSNPLFYQQGTKEVIFLLTVQIVIIWWVDSTEFYYNLNTKNYFIRLDQMMTVLFLATLLNDFLEISYQEYLFVSAALLLILLIHIINLPHNHCTLLTIPLSTISTNHQRDIAEYFLQIKNMLRTESHQRLESFASKMQQQIQNDKLQQKLKCAKTEGVEAQRQVIDQFVIKELKRYSEHSSLLKDLLLYMYLPSRRVYSYLDLKNCHHRREYQRILSQKSVQFVNQSYEANRQLQQAKTRLFTCSDIARRLYRELVKERINLERILSFGQQYLSILYMFITQNAAQFQRSPKASLLLFKFSQLCLSNYFKLKMMQNIKDNSSILEKEAQVIIGTEQENIGLIMHLNVGFMKIGSITRRVSQKMSFSTIIPQEFEAFVQYLMRDSSNSHKKQIEQTKVQFAWIVNSLGNIVCCSWRLNQSFYQSQRCIELSLNPIYIEKALMIIDQAGKLLGVSELARYFGFISDSKNLRLDEALVNQLIENDRIHVMEGATLVNSQLYAAPFDFSLNLLNALQIPFYEKKIYVVQMLKNQKRDLLKTGIFKRQKAPVEFEFHYSWSGKISNYKIQDDLPQFQKQESRVIVNYGENITEMRFFREIIDYKSNFERDEERDCPSLPRQLEENLPLINQEHFYQKWHRKRNETPTWFKLAILVMVLIVLCSIAVFVLFLTNFSQFSQIQTTNLNYVCKLYEKLQATIKLSTLTVFSQLGLPQNSTLLINDQISLSSTISNDLYSFNSNAFTQVGGQALLQQLNTINLYINNYLQNAASSAKITLNQLTQTIPNFYNFLDGIITANTSRISANSNLGLLSFVVFTVTVGLLMALLWFLQYRLSLQQNEIVEVLKSLDNDYLCVVSNRAQKFKEIWLQENDLPEYEEQQLVTDQQKHNYSKHTVSSFNLHLTKPIQVVWFAVMLLLLFLIRNFVQQLNNTAIQYTSLTTYTFKHITALHQTWTLFNLNSSQSIINTQIAFTFDQEYRKILALRDIAVNPLVNFGPFYLSFWQRDQFCNYMNISGCTTLLGLGTSEGANVVVSFVSEQYDSYLNYNSNVSAIYNRPDVKKLGQIVYFYLDQIVHTNKQGILDDFNNITNQLWLNVLIVFSFSMLSALLFSLFALYYHRLHRDHQRHQEMLMLISFDKLQTLPAFHKFYNKRFSSV